MSKSAIIIGAAGQDGQLLQALLDSKGYQVVCIDVGIASSKGLSWNKPVDITRAEEVFELVAEIQPNEVYHLAAIHQSAQEISHDDLALYRQTYEVNFFSLLNVLEAIRLRCNNSRLFYAASSHIFGHTYGGAVAELQNEDTPFNPETTYAMTKVSGIWACRQYRTRHGIFASVGILYNHESSLREEKFLTKKVIRAVADVKRGRQSQVVLGDLSAEVDWGYAPDYVEAMHAILSAAAADDFVVATGIGHTVREFVAAAFLAAGITDWEQYVLENPEAIQRRRRNGIGNSSKLTRVTRWRPKTTFPEMVRLLLRDEMQTKR